MEVVIAIVKLRDEAVRTYLSLFNFLFPQCVSFRDVSNSRRGDNADNAQLHGAPDDGR